jgi:deazaflavin-dependent oxidoreductase (nitroreductase family)
MAGVDNPRSRPMTPFQERLGRVTVQWMTGINNVAYRLSGGRVAGHVPSGAPICLLTTTGRRTKQRRTVPLLCLRDGADLVVVASRGGMSAHPAWYLNLRADPRAVVQLGHDTMRVRARDATEEERHRLWPALTAVYEYFDAYQARTSRRIPMVILSPD